LTIEAVVFDFDGVLANTESLHLLATQDAIAARGWTLAERAYFDRYLGYGDRDLVIELAKDRGEALDETSIATLVRAKGAHYVRRLAAANAMYPSAAACIQRLGARYALAIASGSLQSEIVAILDAAGLRSAFPVIIGADDCASGKPHPEPYAKAAAHLGVSPNAAVAIEDSRWGLESARAAGLRTIGVTTTYPASALAADLIVSSLDELTVDVIATLGHS
jgi:HAD superfamily hydrolase (TIGR01509 family)